MAIEVYPVVHIKDIEQAEQQTAVAFEAGADGVYLIDHERPNPVRLLHTFEQVKQQWPERFIGINALQLPSGPHTFQYLRRARQEGLITKYPDGVWTDDALHNRNVLSYIRRQDKAMKHIRYLGGTAFKYTLDYTDDPDEAAFQARDMKPFVDVVTTSGPGTNKAPEPAKIAAMKKAAGRKPLAVASGISVDNIEKYKGNIDQILVASSVETEPYSGKFDKAKLHEFIAKAHSL